MIDVTEPGGDYDVPALRIRGQHMLPRLRDTVTRAHKLGVKIVTGSDTGYGPNSLTRIGQEIAQSGRAWASRRSGAPVGNDRQRRDAAAGEIDRRLEPGYEADLIAVERNPLENIATTQDPLLVISNGRIGLDRLNFGK